MRKSKHKPLKKGTPYAFVVDGESEQWYIQMLQRNEKIRLRMSPEIPDKKSVSDQFARVIELATDYQKVFWIVDLD